MEMNSEAKKEKNLNPNGRFIQYDSLWKDVNKRWILVYGNPTDTHIRSTSFEREQQNKTKIHTKRLSLFLSLAQILTFYKF